MSYTLAEGRPMPSAGVHEADGEIYEIRYVDAAEAATWACERGVSFLYDDMPPPAIGYFD